MPVLEPVEKHPDEVNLVPIDYQPDFPFQADPYTAATPASQDPLGIGNAIADRVALPQRLVQGIQPETPGMMSEADAFRLNQLEDQAQAWAARQALNNTR